MSLYSGKSDSSVGQLIAKAMSRQDIYDILSKLYAPHLGTIKLFYNCQKRVNQANDLLNNNIITQHYSDGWVYPNGSFISKSIFPEMYELLKNIQYDGKNNTGYSITLPSIDNFFKLNPNKVQNPFKSENFVQQINMLKIHKHGFNIETNNNEEIGIENATYVWATKSPSSNTDLQEKADENGDVYPCFHEGQTKSLRKCTECNWNVKIERDADTIAATINCTTSDVLPEDIKNQIKICPKHICIPCLMYIGRPVL